MNVIGVPCISKTGGVGSESILGEVRVRCETVVDGSDGKNVRVETGEKQLLCRNKRGRRDKWITPCASVDVACLDRKYIDKQIHGLDLFMMNRAYFC